MIPYGTTFFRVVYLTERDGKLAGFTLGIRDLEYRTVLVAMAMAGAVIVTMHGASPLVELVVTTAGGMGLPEPFHHLSPISAAGIFLAGLAALLSQRGFMKSTVIGGGLVVLTGLLMLLQIRIGGVADIEVASTSPGAPISLCAMTAICLLISGSALLSRGADHFVGDGVSTVTFILQVLLASAAAVALSANWVDAISTTLWGRLTHLPLPYAVSFLVLGLGLTARSWAEGRKPEGPSYWTPIMAFASAVTVTLSIWQALHEDRQTATGQFSSTTGDFSDEALLLFGLIMATSLASAIAAASKARSAANDAMAYAARFRHAERIANLFHWRTGPRLEQWTYASDYAETFYGLPLEEFFDGRRNFASIVYAGDRPRVLAEYDAINQNPKPFAIEYRFVHPEGIRFCREVGEPIFDAKGNVRYFRGTTQDITEKRSTEAQLMEAKADAENANRAKSEFLAHMSHELRTPLNSIIGFSQIINNQVFGRIGNSKYEDYLSVIERSAQHLLSLINDVLDLTKVEAGKVEMSESLLRVPDLMREAVELVFGAAEIKRVHFRIEPETEQTLLYGDKRSVLQCLTNLLSNARKFTPEGGTVTLGLALATDNGYRISVSDTGIGIAEDKLDLVLEPFSQVRLDVEHSTQGTGLGLAIVKRLMELHGGRIALNSKLGDGTTVTLFFPQQRTIRADSTEMQAASA